MRHTNRKDGEQRTLLFLKDLHKQIQEGDEMPRAVYTAMTYHLGWTAVAAAVDLGIIRKAGWRWYWMSSAPSADMAAQVNEARLEAQRRNMQRYLRFK